MIKITKIKYYVLPLLAVMAIPYYFWFDDRTGIVTHIDYSPPLFPEVALKNIHNIAYSWNDFISSGVQTDGFYHCTALYIGIMTLLQNYFSTAYVAQLALFTFQIALCFFSILFLSITCFPRHNPLVHLCGSLLYIANPYFSILYGTLGIQTLGIAYILLPLFLGCYIRSILNSQFNKYIFITPLITAIFYSLASNPPTWLFMWLPLLIYYMFNKIYKNKQKTLFTILIIAITMLINLPWMYALFIKMLQTGTAQYIELDSMQESFYNLFHKNASIKNVMQSTAMWYFDSPISSAGRSIPYIPQATFIHKFLFLVSFLLVFLLCICNIAYTQTNKIKNTLFIFILLFSIYFSKGNNEPFGLVNLLLFKYIPIVNLYRECPTRFIILVSLSLSLLMVSSLNNFYTTFLTKYSSFNKICPSIFIIILVIFSYYNIGKNIFSTNFFGMESVYLGKPKVNFPQSLLDCLPNTDNPQISKIVQVPLYPFSYIGTSWGYYSNISVYYYSFKPVQYAIEDKYSSVDTYFTAPETERIVKKIAQNIEKNLAISELCSFINIGQLLIRNDILFKDRENATIKDIYYSNIIKNSIGEFDIKKTQYSKLISMHTINSKDFTQLIYIPTKISISEMNFEDYIEYAFN